MFNAFCDKEINAENTETGEEHSPKSGTTKKLDKLKKISKEFCGSTSIHGVQYLAEEGRPIYERLLWLLILSVSVFFAGQSIYKSYQNWRGHPVVISFEEKSTPIVEIPFPAVTICPVTNIKMSKVEFIRDKIKNGTVAVDSFSKEEQQILEAMAQMGELKEEFKNQSGTLVDNYTRIWKDIYLPLADIRAKSDANPKGGIRKMLEGAVKLSTRFDNIITEFGICFSYNFFDLHHLLRKEAVHSDFVWNEVHRTSFIAWDPENGYTNAYVVSDQEYPKRKQKGGMESTVEWKFSLTENDLENKIYDKYISDGFYLMVHSPIDYPQASNLIPLGLGEIYSINVKPIQRKLSKELMSYSPEQRKCYVTGEKYLRFFRYYTKKNCELECQHNYTLAQCKCVPYHLPRNQSTVVCNVALKNNSECVSNAQLMMKKNEWGGGQCDCKPACFSIHYDVEISQSPLEDEKRADVLKVFFKEDTFWSYKRSELYAISDFFSNCGGVLSLFLGMSVLSATEFLYHFIIRLLT